jgi:hypothetical protein
LPGFLAPHLNPEELGEDGVFLADKRRHEARSYFTESAAYQFAG